MAGGSRQGDFLYGVRFLRQRDQYSCGPIAILNALKWAGLQLTYKDNFKQIKKLCKTTASWGTTPENITNVLSKYTEHLNFEIKALITLKDIERHLKKGGAVILEYWFKENLDIYDGHYVFIFQIFGKDFVVANGIDGKEAIHICSRKELKSMLRCKRYRNTGSPSAWLLIGDDNENM